VLPQLEQILRAGLRFVYAGNLPGQVGDLENTRLLSHPGRPLPACGAPIPGTLGTGVSRTDHVTSVRAAAAARVFPFNLRAPAFSLTRNWTALGETLTRKILVERLVEGEMVRGPGDRAPNRPVPDPERHG